MMDKQLVIENDKALMLGLLCCSMFLCSKTKPTTNGVERLKLIYKEPPVCLFWAFFSATLFPYHTMGVVIAMFCFNIVFSDVIFLFFPVILSDSNLCSLTHQGLHLRAQNTSSEAEWSIYRTKQNFVVIPPN